VLGLASHNLFYLNFHFWSTFYYGIID